tara:strand:+ start:3101 stop:3322 length:222 start_codon:yes stop_codon:yes gene_type:complete
LYHRSKPYTFAIRTSQRYAKNCKRVSLANAQSVLTLNKQDVESLLTTMHKNNSGFIATTKQSKYKKDLCLTEN